MNVTGGAIQAAAAGRWPHAAQALPASLSAAVQVPQAIFGQVPRWWQSGKDMAAPRGGPAPLHAGDKNYTKTVTHWHALAVRPCMPA